jgi:hypothetical protein
MRLKALTADLADGEVQALYYGLAESIGDGTGDGERLLEDLHTELTPLGWTFQSGRAYPPGPEGE